jgi:hypothetical protein
MPGRATGVTAGCLAGALVRARTRTVVRSGDAAPAFQRSAVGKRESALSRPGAVRNRDGPPMATTRVTWRINAPGEAVYRALLDPKAVVRIPPIHFAGPCVHAPAQRSFRKLATKLTPIRAEEALPHGDLITGANKGATRPRAWFCEGDILLTGPNLLATWGAGRVETLSWGDRRT